MHKCVLASLFFLPYSSYWIMQLEGGKDASVCMWEIEREEEEEEEEEGKDEQRQI